MKKDKGIKRKTVKESDEFIESSDRKIHYKKEKVINRTGRPLIVYDAYGDSVLIPPRESREVARGSVLKPEKTPVGKGA